MKTNERLMLCMCIAPLIWLADSLIMRYSHGISFVSALWCFGSSRLLLRIIAVLLVLMPGVAAYIGDLWRRAEIISMNKADDGRLFGEEQTDDEERRILFYALRLATMMKLPSKEQHNLRLLCYSHDIGMVMLPPELQQRPPRTVGEQTVYYQHAEYGAQLAETIPRLRSAARLIRFHEEHYDGSGPNALLGRSIPLACRIFSVVRMYDGFNNDADLHLTQDEVLHEMSLYRGTVLDPDVYDAFYELLHDAGLMNMVKKQVYSPVGTER